MAGLGLMFAGQGSQYVGMGQEMARHYPEARHVFAVADEVLGYTLSRLCFQGPEAELVQTEKQQPAILATSLACWEVLRRRSPEFITAAGLSLGEYGALTAAGVFSLSQVLPLVRTRGRLMQEAVPPGVGGMAAIIGLDAPVVEDICRQVRAQGVVEPANYNCPGQVVVSGHKTAVARAVELAVEAGARRTQWLAVSAPFHTSLLVSAQEGLTAEMEKIPMVAAAPPVVTNVNADLVENPEEIRQALALQVSHPVLWQQSLETMAGLGVTTLVELGPGRVLSGFARRTWKGFTTLAVQDPATMEEALEHLEGVG